ncbi:transcriptional regulator SUPERMAN-like [Zingiber officinale]|uniref:C2H2-type domain-containing protein n=1 Tax=Zingiber officinale TaxID=94328 RepID=A0A8J5FZ92_ZINOF|nr:transcriptional regulator SUPERMAN-like [Zingiber officinale]KAG6498635.1 hypothetical protein ZIOFF_038356 [Zingiber officinale]
MEQRKNWMWRRNLKPNNVVGSSQLLSHDPAWEEKAFAEDSAGLLGAYIWPPRSYSCSFCRREFRSAQALGGHMNSHRRDRARLKQWADQEGIVPSRTNNVVALPSHHLSLIRVSEVSSTTAAAAVAAASSTASFADSSRRKRDMEDEESFRMKRWRVEEESFKLLAPSPVEEQLDLELRLGTNLSQCVFVPSSVAAVQIITWKMMGMSYSDGKEMKESSYRSRRHNAAWGLVRLTDAAIAFSTSGVSFLDGYRWMQSTDHTSTFLGHIA